MTKRKLLTIPIEIFQREFDLALYMALVATEKGFQVLVGHQEDRVFKISRNGIYYHKDHANWSEVLYRSAMKRGMKSCALDVEGLIYLSEDSYLDNRVNKWILENIDIVFAWGDKQKQLLNKKTAKSNIINVGSPKFDMCKLEKDNYTNKVSAKKVRKILINTRFGYVNSFRKEGIFNVFEELGILKSQKDIEAFKILVDNDKLIFNEFLSFIKMLANNNDFQITIRPHQAESIKIYNDIASDYQNIIIDNSSDLRIQILSHDCLIHDGCTTAIEARALGKPVFGLRPVIQGNAYNNYANKYSLNFTSAVELYNYFISRFITEFKMPDIQELAQKSIYNWEGVNGNATHMIVKEFEKLKIPYQKLVKIPWYNKLNTREVLFNLAKKSLVFDQLFYKIWGEKFKKFKSRELRIRSKTAINMFEVREKAVYYNNLDPNNTTHINNLAIIRISKSSILLYKTLID